MPAGGDDDAIFEFSEEGEASSISNDGEEKKSSISNDGEEKK